MLKEPRISILGGGLSALFSYWGALDCGYKPSEIEIITDKIGRTEGTVFLYESPIPWKSVIVTSILLGTCREYSLKQWGDPTIITSAHRRFKMGINPIVEEELFLPSELLPVLWSLIPNIQIKSRMEEKDIEKLAKDRVAVICTFPDTKTIEAAIHDDLIHRLPYYFIPCSFLSNVVVYNGIPEGQWVRQSSISGTMYVEYPATTSIGIILELEEKRGNGGGQVNFLPEIKAKAKPLTAEERRKDNIFRVGRFAEMNPLRLSHECRYEVGTFLRNLDVDS